MANFIDKENISDEDLMKHFCNTLDEQIFQILMKRYYSIAINIVRKRVFNTNNADDIVQEAFVRVVKNRDKFDRTQPFAGWFYRIISNLCIDYLRKELREKEKISIFTDVLSTKVNSSNVDLEKLLLSVKENDREILIDHYIRGFTFKELSEKLGKSAESIKKRAQRAIKKIREENNEL